LYKFLGLGHLSTRRGQVQHSGMRHLFRSLLVAPALALSACGGGGDAGSGQNGPLSSATSISLDQEFLLGHGESAYLNGMELEFTTLVEDYRCGQIPGVVCVWEGNARILIQATRAGTSASLELNTGGPYPKSAIFGSYSVTLVHLSPYPNAVVNGQWPPAEAYEATLRVTRAGS
jgi:hypothetical protein